MGHSDFSHGVTCDFTSRLIRPATRPRRAGPYEISRGNAESFPTAPSAHTLLCPGAPSISFAPIVRARYRLDRADRFAIFGYGSVFCLKPFRPHLAVGALSCANAQHDTATHTHHVPPPIDAQRGITPAFGYGPRLGPVRLDFHQLVLCAARRTLRPPPTPTRQAIHFPRSSVIGRHAPTTRPPPRTAPQQRSPQVIGPGRASPVPAVTMRTFRAPYAGEFLAAALQALHRFHGLHPGFGGLGTPCLPPEGRTPNDAAGFA
jgi:hypothetical protein